MTHRLSVVVPAFNEEVRVGELLRLMQASLAPLGDEHEIIVVDDGSTDATAERVAATGATLVIHERNQGKAAAVQTGLAATKGQFVAVLDADLEYFPEDLVPMLHMAESAGIVAVYGSRYLEGENFRPGPLGRLRVLRDQELSSWVANWTLTGLVLGLYGKKITDTLTGLKVYPGDFLRAQRLTSVGFEGDHEITAKLIKANIPVLETPIKYAPRGREEGKKIGPRDGVKAVTTFVGQRFSPSKGDSADISAPYKNTAASPPLMALAGMTSRLLRSVGPARTGAALVGEMADYVAWQKRNFDSPWPLYSQRERLWREMASRMRQDTPVLVVELGVAWGYTTAYWLQNLVGPNQEIEWHGFDRFTGLPRSWRRFPAGAFDANGAPPAIDDTRVHWHVGDVEVTMDEIDFSTYVGHQRVVLFDLDIYEPTVECWNRISPHLRPGDLLYFDEALAEDERRVLDDLVLPYGSYEHLGSTSLSLGLQVLDVH